MGYCALSGNAYEGRLALSFSASAMSFSCYYLNSGMASLSAYAQRQVVTVSSGGVVAAPGSVVVTSTSAWYSGPGVYSVAQDATGSLYLGAGGVVAGNASLASVGPTGGAVSAYGVLGSATKVSLFANAVYACVLGSGIYRVPLRGALSLAPVLATTCGATCVDFVFQSGQIRECLMPSEVRLDAQICAYPSVQTVVWVCDPTTGVWRYTGATWSTSGALFNAPGAASVSGTCVAMTAQVEPAAASFVLYFVGAGASYPIFRYVTSTATAYRVVNAVPVAGGVFGGLTPVPFSPAAFVPGDIVVLRASALGALLNASTGECVLCRCTRIA